MEWKVWRTTQLAVTVSVTPTPLQELVATHASQISIVDVP